MGEHSIDKFGELEMNEAEYAKKEKAILVVCKCKGCPSFVSGDSMVEDGIEEGAYCFPPVGGSKVIKWEKDCICSTCPVYKEYDLEHTHYCTRCSELCQIEGGDAVGGDGGGG